MIALLWSWVSVHPYLVLAPLVLLEGPLATILAGTLAAAGAASWPAVWAVVVAADLAADCAYFLLGRAGRRPWPARLLRRLGLDEVRRERLTRALSAHLPRVVVGAKIADVAAVPTLLTAGLAGVPLRRFLPWAAGATAVKSTLLLVLGGLFGARIAPLLTPTTSLLVLAGVVATYLFARALARSRTRRKARHEPPDVPRPAAPHPTAPRPDRSRHLRSARQRRLVLHAAPGVRPERQGARGPRRRPLHRPA